MMGLAINFLKNLFSLFIFKNIGEKFRFYLIYLAMLSQKTNLESNIETYNDKNFILINQINISNAFLNKWFYYRYFSNFIEKHFLYSNFNQISLELLNLSYSEMNFYNLKVNNKRSLGLNEKLDFYFKENLTKKKALALTNVFTRNFLLWDKNFKSLKRRRYSKRIFVKPSRRKNYERYAGLKFFSRYSRYFKIAWRRSFKRGRFRKRKKAKTLRISKIIRRSRRHVFRLKKKFVKKFKFKNFTKKIGYTKKHKYLKKFQMFWIRNYFLKRKAMWNKSFALDNQNLLKSSGRIVRPKIYRKYNKSARYKLQSSVNLLKKAKRKIVKQKYRKEIKNRKFKKDLFMTDTHFMNLFLIFYKNKLKEKKTPSLYYNFWFSKKVII